MAVARAYGANLVVLDRQPPRDRREGRGTDLVMKVAEPTPPTLPWRLHPMDRDLLRDPDRPVWLLDPAQGSTLHVVLAAVGLDGSLGPRDAAVLRTGASLARRLQGDLHVVLPWEFLGSSILASPIRGLSPGRWRKISSEIEEAQQSRLARWVAEVGPGVVASPIVRRGDAPSVIREVAWEVEADVVVAGDTSPGGPDRFILGAPAERLGLAAPCSLLLVKGGGWDDGHRSWRDRDQAVLPSSRPRGRSRMTLPTEARV